MKLPIAWRIALGFVVPLVLFGVMAGTAIVQMNAMQAITKTVSDRVALNAAARDILLQLVNLEAGVRAYVDTGNTRFVDDYERGSTQLAQDVDLVANATGDRRLTAAFADAKTQIAAITKYDDSEVSLVDKKLRTETDTFLQISAEDGSRARVIALSTMIGLGTVAIAVVVFTALLLGRGIAARIARVQVALGEVVRTDFPAITEATKSAISRAALTNLPKVCAF